MKVPKARIVFITLIAVDVAYIPNKKFYELHDASWDERFAIAGLIFCVAGLGICPLFFENMIIDAVHPIFEHIIEYVPQLGNL